MWYKRSKKFEMGGKGEELYMNWKELYHLNRKQVFVFITVLTMMITMAVCQCRGGLVYSASDADMAINTTFGENMETYAGIFSTAVTASVNPTATLAVLAVVGMTENAAVYFPEVQWINHVADTLNTMPFVRTISELPIANPWAAGILVVVAITMYVIHSTSASKMFSKATIDNIEQWGGMIVTVALSLLPLATTQVVAAEANIRYVSAGTYVVSLILSILSAIFTAVVYICIYGCMDAIELLAAVVPIKGMNAIVQILKSILHMILVLLQFFSPVLSVIVSLILMVTGILLFRKLSTLSTYYTYIYVKPLWKALWHKDDLVPLVHRKFPRRGHKRYPAVELAVPVFSMNRIGKIKKRELVWLIQKDHTPYLVYMKRLHKVQEIPLSEVNLHGDTLYLQKTFRFTRILTEDKQVELIISNEYSNQWQRMLEWLQLSDFRVVEERRKQEKETVRSRKEALRRQKREEQEKKWEEQMERLTGPKEMMAHE